ncbi:His-Xaa-Ser system radical SAM maturase HxsB [Candidatus Roizmanbacteria bacterium]|nr:His-Xaa-Ser system radical SAM maturase HxsB [Candidatus Roizmanbacteria bacterium]
MAIFFPLESFLPETGYDLLPFDFTRLDSGEYLLINLSGEFLRLEADIFEAFTRKVLTPNSNQYWNLNAKHFLRDSSNKGTSEELLASKYRTKKSFIEGFTKLHIFVTSIRCNQSCQYCQVSRHNESDGESSDMSLEVLHKSIDLMLKNPSRNVTMEFQGGESLLRFDLVKEGVLYTKRCNEAIGKHVNFVICTNLTLLSDDHLAFFKEHNVQISASLDGPAKLHNKNRPISGSDAYSTVVRNIRRSQEALGSDAVSALMTTSRESLKYPKEIVDEYLSLGLRSLFVRELNPYGYALKTKQIIGYSIDDFIEFYKKILPYIIQVNRNGSTFAESYITLILTKILTPWPVGFVDLQSPAGAGMGVVVYNYDGDVYASDESRMLAEMGDTSFRLGNVLDDSYEDIFFGETMQNIALVNCNEALAGCSDCVYHTYCGADPVRNYATQKDFYGYRPASDFCYKNLSIIKYAFKLISASNHDADLYRIIWSWITRGDVNQMDNKRYRN